MVQQELRAQQDLPVLQAGQLARKVSKVRLDPSGQLVQPVRRALPARPVLSAQRGLPVLLVQMALLEHLAPMVQLVQLVRSVFLVRQGLLVLLVRNPHAAQVLK
jgi:hypothetical protein